MKRTSLLLCLCTLLVATAAKADVYRCTVGRKVPVYANIACGPDAVRLDLPGIPIMVRDPGAGPAPRRGKTRIESPRHVASASGNDTAQIQAWAKASRDRLPPSLGGKPPKAEPVTRPSVAKASPTEEACNDARATLSKAEQRAWESGKRLSFTESRRLNDAIFDVCY